jgi:hypothetical protein
MAVSRHRSSVCHSVFHARSATKFAIVFSTLGQRRVGVSDGEDKGFRALRVVPRFRRPVRGGFVVRTFSRGSTPGY